MPEYLSPGVYVEEVDRGPKPIEGVGTAMAAFVGFTEKAQGFKMVEGEPEPVELLNRAKLITNWTQFTEHYGGFIEGAYLPQAVYGYFNNGGNRCYVVSVKTIGSAQGLLLGGDGKPHLRVRARQAGFDGLRLRLKVEGTDHANGAAAKDDKPDPKSGSKDKKDEPEPAPTNGSRPPFTITVERQSISGNWQPKEKLSDMTLIEGKTDEGKKTVEVIYKNNRPSQWIELEVPDSSLPLATLWPRTQQLMLTMEPEELAPPSSKDLKGDVAERTGIEGLEVLDNVTMVCVPDLMTTAPGKELDLKMVQAVQASMIAHCERLADRVAILDPPPDMTPQEIRKWRLDTVGYDSSYAALYYPWIQVDDPVHNRPIYIPPSGHMAGIWARNDNTRGVHKAPANEVIQGAIGLAYDATKGEQDTLNPDGINCIRAFPGRGIRVWGARSLSSDPAWRYVSVRRLFNFVEKSIERGTQWVVFEPNDHKLWARVRRDVSAFLRVVWRDGALFGLTPEEAFYVKCDEELNPPESRDLGRLIIEIGLCPVKPAEFVIFRISQWAGPNAEA